MRGICGGSTSLPPIARSRPVPLIDVETFGKGRSGVSSTESDGGFGPGDANYIYMNRGWWNVLRNIAPPVNRCLRMIKAMDTENIGLTARKNHTNVTSRVMVDGKRPLVSQ